MATPLLEEQEPFKPPAFEQTPLLSNPSDTAAFALAEESEIDINARAAPEYRAPDEFRPAEEDTAEGRLTGLLESDSKYIKNARLRGTEQANSRGLLNSSMAAGASERAAIEAGAPVAMQDARSLHEAGMAGYQGEITGALATQKYGADVGIVEAQARGSAAVTAVEGRQKAALASLDADLKAGLSSQEALQKAQQSAYDAALQAGLSRQHAEQEAAAAGELARTRMEQEIVQQDGATLRTDMELKSREMLEQLNLDAADRENASSLIEHLGNSLMEQIRMIQADPNITAENKAKIIQNLRAQYEESVLTVSAIHGIEIGWLSPDAGTGGTGTGGTGGTGGDDGGGGASGDDGGDDGGGGTGGPGGGGYQDVTDPAASKKTGVRETPPAGTYEGPVSETFKEKTVKNNDEIKGSDGEIYTVIDPGGGADNEPVVVRRKGDRDRDNTIVLERDKSGKLVIPAEPGGYR